MSEEVKEDIDKEYKWSWAKFFIGLTRLITSQEFIVFAVYSVIMFMSMTNGNGQGAETESAALTLTLSDGHTWIIGYIVISCIFILKKCLEKVLEIIARNTNINAELKFGAQTNINKTTAKIAEAVKKTEE
jgi:hypothetical protein